MGNSLAATCFQRPVNQTEKIVQKVRNGRRQASETWRQPLLMKVCVPALLLQLCPVPGSPGAQAISPTWKDLSDEVGQAFHNCQHGCLPEALIGDVRGVIPVKQQ